MPQTFYIENDEEIISVIGRLRKSSFEENYFVFPKRAIVLQSIVNLRLLQREAEKLGKKIIMVTQDDAGKMLAEKAGLMTERYTDDFSKQSEHLEIASPSASIHTAVPERLPTSGIEHSGLRSKDIGSSDFYAVASAEPTKQREAPAEGIRTLRIRNASPDKLVSLNSKRVTEQVLTPRPEPPMMDFHPHVAMPVEPVVLPSEQQSAPQIRGGESYAVAPTVQKGREERLRNFFSNGGVAPTPREVPRVVPQKKSVAPQEVVVAHKAKGVLIFFGAVSVLSLIGIGAFLFLPKAEVRIIPYATSQTADLLFEGRVDSADDGERVVAVRIVDREESVTLNIEATGTSLGSAQKARGTVIISNMFSSDPQSLVATTRLESADGKIFRLVEGVTVPGMKGSEPGTVEVAVIADQTGVDYNLAPSSFTIPGFKGGSKYDKFSARSTKAMAGGNASSGTNQTIIAKNDLELATLQAKTQAKQSYLDAVSKELLPGERVLEENIDIVPLNDASLPLSGTAATSFEYQNTFRVRGFVFSEESIRQRIVSGSEARVGNVTFRPVSVTLSYGEAIPDFENKTVRLKTHALITSESVVDREKFLADILGKNAAGIDTLLESYPAIKKIEISFKPQWFSSSVPTSPGRVTLLLEPGQE